MSLPSTPTPSSPGSGAGGAQVRIDGSGGGDLGPSDAVLVFDLFGVIARTQDPVGQRELEQLVGAEPAAEEFWAAYWRHRPAYDRGAVTGARYWAAVGEDLDLTMTPELAVALVDADVRSWSRIDPAMVELLHRLRRASRRIALLSNAPHEIAAAMRTHQGWLELFDGVVFSCEAGTAKPEPAAFRAVEQTLAADSRSFVMIDDRTENITAAKEFGWAGITFTGPAHLAEWLAADPV